MTVTDVSDDVILSYVQSDFTKREQRILDQLFQTVFSQTLAFIEDQINLRPSVSHKYYRQEVSKNLKRLKWTAIEYEWITGELWYIERA